MLKIEDINLNKAFLKTIFGHFINEQARKITYGRNNQNAKNE
ncbi:hypothetical protein [Algoriphagus confluentis]|uniref:Uncharacterized protein n=2 Tax=Algoriphagus TaxID=246875 RepID=A0ABQ6PRB1_9BACT|nr:hypothetical protein Aconfl_24330 [Algoriphagus confluentis]GMQ32489.1 hypothetical protein Ataiwa_07610 [Algoriphagus taiwanensis]